MKAEINKVETREGAKEKKKKRIETKKKATERE